MYIYIFHPLSTCTYSLLSPGKNVFWSFHERGVRRGCTAIDLMGVLLAAVKHHIKPSSSLLTSGTKKDSFDKWLLYDRHHSFTGRHGLNSSASVRRFRESPSPLPLPSILFSSIFSPYLLFLPYRYCHRGIISGCLGGDVVSRRYDRAVARKLYLEGRESNEVSVTLSSLFIFFLFSFRYFEIIRINFKKTELSGTFCCYLTLSRMEVTMKMCTLIIYYFYKRNRKEGTKY